MKLHYSKLIKNVVVANILSASTGNKLRLINLIGHDFILFNCNKKLLHKKEQLELDLYLEVPLKVEEDFTNNLILEDAKYLLVNPLENKLGNKKFVERMELLMDRPLGIQDRISSGEYTSKYIQDLYDMEDKSEFKRFIKEINEGYYIEEFERYILLHNN